MENNAEINVVLAKKMDSWRYEADNLVAPQELTITITLNEYRELIVHRAKADYVKEGLERELRATKEEKDKLMAEICYLQNVVANREG